MSNHDAIYFSEQLGKGILAINEKVNILSKELSWQELLVSKPKPKQTRLAVNPYLVKLQTPQIIEPTQNDAKLETSNAIREHLAPFDSKTGMSMH